MAAARGRDRRQAGRVDVRRVGGEEARHEASAAVVVAVVVVVMIIVGCPGGSACVRRGCAVVLWR